MPTRTLLQYTQDILASLDGEDVTAIADTAESGQVAAIVRQAFYEIVANNNLQENYKIFELTETSSSTPTIMTLPSTVISLDWVKYDNKLTTETDPLYQQVYELSNADFFAMQDSLNIDEDYVDSFNYTLGSDTFPIKHRTDVFPGYYTVYAKDTLIFDAYNISEETFLRKSKTWCQGSKDIAWTHADSFVPTTNPKLDNLLFQSAKAQAFVELKQTENASVERKARRAGVTIQKQKDKEGRNAGNSYYNSYQLPNYGRK